MFRSRGKKSRWPSSQATVFARMPRARRAVPPPDFSARRSRACLAGFDAQEWAVDYGAVATAALLDQAGLAPFLAKTLPHCWVEKYVERTDRPTAIVRVDDGPFAYVFDWYSRFAESEAAGHTDLANEDRLVAAFGHSQPADLKRNAGRQRGWIGPTDSILGPDRDKGHFVPHSIGGALEINLFVQERKLNRGWSPTGKAYRAIEHYCLNHPGTFFFNRPIYADGSAQPALLEVGIVTVDGTLRVEQFEN